MKIMKTVKILEYYTANRMILDGNAILNIVGAFLDENNLVGIVNNINFFAPPSFNYYAMYEGKSKNIYFDLHGIYKHYSKKYHEWGVNIPFFQFINEHIIISMFHELCHAIFVSVPSFTNSISRNIINYILGIIKNEDMLDVNIHDYFPYEREADAFAYTICLSMYQSIDKSFVDNETIRYLYISILEMFLKGYDGGYDNPLRKVINVFSPRNYVENDYYLMQKDIYFSNMNLYDRLRYGFPVTREEISYLKNILNYYKLYPRILNPDIEIGRLILGR